MEFLWVAATTVIATFIMVAVVWKKM